MTFDRGIELNGFGYVGLGTNGTNFNDFWKFDQVLSLLDRNLESIELSAYPNPAISELNIKVDLYSCHPSINTAKQLVSKTASHCPRLVNDFWYKKNTGY